MEQTQAHTTPNLTLQELARAKDAAYEALYAAEQAMSDVKQALIDACNAYDAEYEHAVRGE